VFFAKKRRADSWLERSQASNCWLKAHMHESHAFLSRKRRCIVTQRMSRSQAWPNDRIVRISREGHETSHTVDEVLAIGPIDSSGFGLVISAPEHHWDDPAAALPAQSPPCARLLERVLENVKGVRCRENILGLRSSVKQFSGTLQLAIHEFASAPVRVSKAAPLCAQSCRFQFPLMNPNSLAETHGSVFRLKWAQAMIIFWRSPQSEYCQCGERLEWNEVSL